MNYENKPDKVLRQLAWDIFIGHVWTGKDKDSLRAFCLPMNFMTQQQCMEHEALPVGLYYEYMSRATKMFGPIPIFESMQWLNDVDAQIVKEYLECLDLYKSMFLNAKPLPGSSKDNTPEKQ